MKYLKFIILGLIDYLCQISGNFVSEREFQKLMENIAEGWSTQNTDLALNSFDKDAVYIEPPNIQYFRGYEQLRPYFDELSDSHKMEFHNLWFDSET